MRVKDAWPVSTPAPLLFVRLLGVVLLASVGWAVENYGVRGYFAVLLASALLFGASSGWKVETSGRELELAYGFGLFKLRTGEILELSNVGGLKLGRLWKDLAGSLIIPLFFLAFSAILFGVRGALVVPFVLYWVILEVILLAYPLRTLKERTGRLMVLALLLPWALSVPLGGTGEPFPWMGLAFFTSLMGFWFVVSFVTIDYVLIVGERGRFVIGCHSAGKVMALLEVGKDEPQADLS